MKVKIIKDGVESAIDPSSLLVGNLTLKQFLDRFIALENDFKRKFKDLEKREKDLKDLMRKL